MASSNPGLETQLPKLLGHKTVLGYWNSGPALAPFLALSQILSPALPSEQTHWVKGHCNAQLP